MFSSYMKVAWRNIARNKINSLINIMGLAIGMASAILLLLNIQYGFSVDQFHQNKANLYTVYNRLNFNGQLICCMGLLGLSAYVAENRTKEIGIRKVLGASVAGITRLLTRSFVQLIMIAIVIASPYHGCS